MFIDDKLRKALVASAEKVGISASILLDYVRTKSDEDELARIVFKNLCEGNFEIVAVRNQSPVFKLTEKGEIEAASLPQENSSANDTKGLYARPLAWRPRGH